MIALAEALGLPFDVKQLEYNALCHLGPRLLGISAASLTQSSRSAIFDQEPPDLTISAGHRSVPVVRALRQRSGGRVRSVHMGFPRVSPSNFDLVVAPPQYPIPDHPNLLRVPYVLTRAATAGANDADEALLASLPSPRSLLIIGGPNLFWKIDEELLLSTLDGMLAETAQQGGSVLVTTSPRTPPELEQQVAHRLGNALVPTLLAAPRKPPAYSSLLKVADSIRITADSVSMISDGIWTGKPIALVPIEKSTAALILFAVMDWLRPRRRVYPQDLRFFWSALSEIGVSQELSIPKTSTVAELRMIVDRVRGLLPTVSKEERSPEGE